MFSSVMIQELKDNLLSPILSPLLENHKMGLIIVGGVALHFGLVLLRLPSWQCPLLHGLGIPCPGCGLSQAIVSLIHGDWKASLTFHAFAPFLLFALVLTSGVTLLPSSQRRYVIKGIEAVERHTGITAVLLISLVLYWLIRLLVFREGFVDLIME